MTKEKKNDSTRNGTRNFIEEGITPFLQPITSGFNGSYSWVEVDAISVSRIPDGTYKATAKGYKQAITGGFQPAIIYVEADTIQRALALLSGEISDETSNWFGDRYAKPRNKRAVARGFGDYND